MEKKIRRERREEIAVRRAMNFQQGRVSSKRRINESGMLREIQSNPNDYGRWVEETRSGVRGDMSPVAIDNDYLRMIIDPIGCSPLGYPDGYNKSTSTFKAITNIDVPYPPSNVTGGGATWPFGGYHVVLVPDLTYPVRYINASAFSTDYMCSFSSNSLQNFITPLRNINSLASPPVVPSTKELIFNLGQTYNIYGTYTTNIVGLAPEQWAFHGLTTASQEEFFGIPFDVGSIVVTCAVTATGGNTAMNVQCTSTSSTPASLPAVVSTPGIYSVTLSGGNATSGTAIPGVGVRISFTGGTSDALVSNISIKYISSGSSKQAWFATAIRDVDIAAQLFQQYRVVSMGGLLSWRGPTIGDGGRAAGYLYRGGLSSGAMGFWDYSTLSSLQGAADNAIKLGTYGIWQPMDTKAMNFRAADAPTDNFPYIVLTGQYSGDGTGTAVIPGVLRLRVASNFECISVSQVVSQFPSRVDTGERDAAVRFLATFPPVMENPLHWDAIANTLRGALKGTFSTAKKAMDFFEKNKSWIVPVASAAGTAMLAL